MESKILNSQEQNSGNLSKWRQQWKGMVDQKSRITKARQIVKTIIESRTAVEGNTEPFKVTFDTAECTKKMRLFKVHLSRLSSKQKELLFELRDILEVEAKEGISPGMLVTQLESLDQGKKLDSCLKQIVVSHMIRRLEVVNLLHELQSKYVGVCQQQGVKSVEGNPFNTSAIEILSTEAWYPFLQVAPKARAKKSVGKKIENKHMTELTSGCLLSTTNSETDDCKFDSIENMSSGVVSFPESSFPTKNSTISSSFTQITEPPQQKAVPLNNIVSLDSTRIYNASPQFQKYGMSMMWGPPLLHNKSSWKKNTFKICNTSDITIDSSSSSSLLSGKSLLSSKADSTNKLSPFNFCNSLVENSSTSSTTGPAAVMLVTRYNGLSQPQKVTDHTTNSGWSLWEKLRCT